MDWKKLQLNRCPKCYKVFKIFKPLITCDCGFAISPKKYADIINNQTKKVDRIQEEENNQEFLNSL